MQDGGSILKTYRAWRLRLKELLVGKRVDAPELPAFDHACAVLSESAYRAPAAREAMLRSVGYETDPDFEASKRYFVAKSSSSAKAVLVFRGTIITDWADLHSDYMIVRQRHAASPDFTKALILVRALIQKYGKRNVTVTGHSLGGTKAIYVASIMGVPCVVFNPGWSPYSVFRSRAPEPACPPPVQRPRIRIHTVLGDHLSNNVMSEDDCNFQVFLYERRKTCDPHSQANFLAMVVAAAGKKSRK